MNKGILTNLKLPTLLCQKCQIKLFQLFKNHPSTSFRNTHFVPTQPSHFSFILFLSPPKIPYHTCQFITKGIKNLKKKPHGISWDSLSHCLTQNLLSYLKTSFPALESNFSFQPANFFANFSLISLKVFFLFLPTKEESPRYFSC